MSQQTTTHQAQTTHPDFQEGLADGMQAFLDGIFFPEHDKVWSEDDVIELVESELNGRLYQRQKSYDALTGIQTLSYLHHLGFIVGYVQQALDHQPL